MAFEMRSTTEEDAAEANDARSKLEALFKGLKAAGLQRSMFKGGE